MLRGVVEFFNRNEATDDQVDAVRRELVRPLRFLWPSKPSSARARVALVGLLVAPTALLFVPNPAPDAGNMAPWVLMLHNAFLYSILTPAVFLRGLPLALGATLFLQLVATIAGEHPPTEEVVRSRQGWGRALLLALAAALVAWGVLSWIRALQMTTGVSGPPSTPGELAMLSVHLALLFAAFHASWRGPSSGLLALVLGNMLASATICTFQGNWLTSVGVHAAGDAVLLAASVVAVARLGLDDGTLPRLGFGALFRPQDVALVPAAVATLVEYLVDLRLSTRFGGAFDVVASSAAGSYYTLGLNLYLRYAVWIASLAALVIYVRRCERRSEPPVTPR